MSHKHSVNALPVRLPRSVSAALSALLLAGAASAAPNINQQGLTGAWSNPELYGQGLLLEIYSTPAGGQLAGGWYTYDTVLGVGYDKQRWYSLSGSLKNGASAANLEIRAALGGSFDQGPQPATMSVGTATIQFTSCTSGLLEYRFDDGRVGTIPLSRDHADVACDDGNREAKQEPQFGLSGNWHRPATPGQGIVLEVNPLDALATLRWFTFAPDGTGSGLSGQRWLMATGSYAQGTTSVTLPIYSALGGTFNSNEGTPAIFQVGTVSLDFIDCERLVFSYAFQSGEYAGRSGSELYQRSGPTPENCAVSG